jgi:pimeloyl-ACP methyl ester carboxylesterase
MKTELDSAADAGSSDARRQRVITLVHGTWASDAAWVQADSKLCQGLSRIDPPPIVRSFHWSGHNSHRARLQAAEALTQQLGATFAEYPQAEHHLIAHSHGGNVALYALRNPLISDRIASVVCLATPFIHAQSRPVEPAFEVLRMLTHSLALAPGAILMLLTFLLAVLIALAQPEWPLTQFLRNTGLPYPFLLGGLVGLCGVVFWGGLRVSRRLHPWLVAQLRPRIERYQRKLVNDYNHRAPHPIPVLNAQVERDEPALWLRALRWMSEPQGDSRAVIMLAAVFALITGGSLVWQFIYDARATESLFSMTFFATYIVVSMILVWLIMLAVGFGFSHLIFIAMPVLFRAHGGGFGEWSLFANWLVLIEARTEPAGGYRLESFRIAAQGKGLRHSQIYEDDRVIARIGQWLTNNTLLTHGRKP